MYILCIILLKKAPIHSVMLKAAKFSPGDIDSISCLSNIASVSLTDEEQAFMIRIDELVTERTFTFWIDKNAFAQEEYENVVLDANERAHEITGHAF